MVATLATRLLATAKTNLALARSSLQQATDEFTQRWDATATAAAPIPEDSWDRTQESTHNPAKGQSPAHQDSPSGGRWRAEESARWLEEEERFRKATAEREAAATAVPLASAPAEALPGKPGKPGKVILPATSRLRRSLLLQQAAQRGEDSADEDDAAVTDVSDAPISIADSAAVTSTGRTNPSAAGASSDAAGATPRRPPPATAARSTRSPDDWNVVYVEHADAEVIDPAELEASHTAARGRQGRPAQSQGTAAPAPPPPAAANSAAAEARAAALEEELATTQRHLQSARDDAAAAAKREADARQQASASRAPVPRPCAKEADDAALCVVCLEGARTHVLVPCGHRCLCEGCAGRYEAHMRMDASWQQDTGPGGGGCGSKGSACCEGQGAAGKGAEAGPAATAAVAWRKGSGHTASHPAPRAQSGHTCPLCRMEVTSVVRLWE